MGLQLLTVREAAARLAVSPWCVYHFRKTGVLPSSIFIELNGGIRILESELDKWVLAQQSAPAQKPKPKPIPIPKRRAAGGVQ